MNKAIINYQVRNLRERLRRQVSGKDFGERQMNKIKEVERLLDTDLEIVGMRVKLCKKCR